MRLRRTRSSPAHLGLGRGSREPLFLTWIPGQEAGPGQPPYQTHRGRARFPGPTRPVFPTLCEPQQAGTEHTVPESQTPPSVHGPSFLSRSEAVPPGRGARAPGHGAHPGAVRGWASGGPARAVRERGGDRWAGCFLSLASFLPLALGLGPGWESLTVLGSNPTHSGSGPSAGRPSPAPATTPAPSAQAHRTQGTVGRGPSTASTRGQCGPLPGGPGPGPAWWPLYPVLSKG